MPRGTEHAASKRASKHRDKASPMLVDYIQTGPTTATEEWAVGHRPEKGGKDHEREMKKKLEQWDQQWKKASSS